MTEQIHEAPHEPHRVEESLPVQLTRMEGVLNLVAERIANTTRIVNQHTTDIGVLKSTTQRLSEQAVARDATAVALAAALKEAETNRRAKSEQTWSPFQRGMAVVGTFVGVVALYLAFIQSVRP